MARIDIKTLVTVFEQRIAELEKNPPEMPMAVLVTLLGNAVDDSIREHFSILIKRDIEEALQDKYALMQEELVRSVLEDVFTDHDFRKKIEEHVKLKILLGFEK